MTEAERNLNYAAAVANHPDPQIRPLLDYLYTPMLPILEVEVEIEGQKKTAPNPSS